MRFHFGISFRLRNLKKFLFPFFLGLLSYFGFSYFNLLSVYAYGNLDSYYNLEVDEVDFSEYDFFGYNMQDLLDLGLNDYDNFYVNTKVEFRSSFTGILFALYPKNANNPSLSIYNNKGSASGSSYHIQSFDFSNQVYYSYYLTDYNENEFQSIYDRLVDCLNNNNCLNTDTSSSYLLPSYYTDSLVNNNDSYNINVIKQGGYFYNNQLPVINRQANINDNWFYVKSIKVNNSLIEFNDYLPAYCDLYNCSNTNDSSFNLYLDKLPFIYSNTNNLSTYNSTISFLPTINIDDYVNNLYTYKFYYGRVNHGTYYTYEQLNCTSSSISNTNDSIVSITTSNVNCTNDLTKYDKYFVTYNFKYENDNLSTSIYGINSSIENGFILHNSLINYYLLDNFNNLPRGFSLMLSNNDTLNNLDSYFYSSNPYIAFDDIPKNVSNITKTTDGYFYKDLPFPKKRSYGYVTNTNLLVYDDLSYSTDTSTTLYIYLSPQTLLSFVDTSNNQNNYTYYDENNNITTSSINLIYDTLDNNTYNLDSVFSDLNNYINDLRQDMFSLHTIMTSIYNTIPTTIRYFFNFFFTLGLIFILYKEMRDS